MPAPWEATRKQWRFYRRLTGRSLPTGCSKREASRLIDLALRGETSPERQPTVRVYGSQLYCPTHRDHLRVTYVVDRDGSWVNQPLRHLRRGGRLRPRPLQAHPGQPRADRRPPAVRGLSAAHGRPRGEAAVAAGGPERQHGGCLGLPTG